MPAQEVDETPERATGDRGASLVEYALLLGLIALVCVVAVAFLGTSLGGSYDKSGQSLISAGFGS
jgi:Flp pilus assembly pilin Flp